MKTKPPKKSEPTRRDVEIDPLTRNQFEDALRKASQKTSEQAKKAKKDSD